MAAKKAAKKATKKAPAKKAAKKAPAKRVGGRPGTAGKAEGAEPVRAYIESLEGWKRDVGRRFDAIIAREAPHARRAVKWSMPFYGIEGQGWIANFAAFKKHVKLQFFGGARLKPQPPLGEDRDSRAIDLYGPEEFDETQVTDWVRQAAKLPGWGKV